MKKRMLFITSLILGISISGCGSSPSNMDNANKDNTEINVESDFDEPDEISPQSVEDSDEIIYKIEDDTIKDYMSIIVGTWVSEGTLGGDSYKYTYTFNDDLSWSVYNERSDGDYESYSGEFFCIMKDDYHDDYYLHLYPDVEKYKEYRAFKEQGDGTYYGGENELTMIILSISENNINLHHEDFTRQ